MDGYYHHNHHHRSSGSSKRHCSHRSYRHGHGGGREHRSAREPVKRSAPSLLDIAAKFVARTLAFQRIEERYPRIPEPVQERLVFWAFPRDERDIRMYSSPCGSTANPLEYQNSPFCQGLRLLEQGAVSNVLQVGFHLSGEVVPNRSTQTSIEPETRFKVSVSFDRCKITSVTCSCNSRDIFWCQHVVALAVYRIRNTDKVPVRVPISETLLQMNREQLQKFVQYLISSHHTEVLPTAQKLSDEILRKSSAINQIPGAPDPTAGQDADEDNTWHLDEAQVQDQVKSYLEQGGYYSASKHLTQMFAKVREMLRAQDSNGSRMLALMTEQFLADPRLVLWHSQGTPMTDKCRQLWDQLGALWVCVVLNPMAGSAERKAWKELLTKWTKIDVCPLEDPDHKPSSRRRQVSGVAAAADDDSASDSPPSCSSRPPILGPDPTATSHAGSRRKPRTVFHKALDALLMSWQDPHLKRIIRGRSAAEYYIKKGEKGGKEATKEDDIESYLWHEHVPTACARVDALRSHGYHAEALRLAVSIVRTMKRNQQLAIAHWRKQCHKILKNCTKSGVSRRPGYASWEGWIGHPMDPIGALFETLAEASLIPEDRGRMGFHLDDPVPEEGAVPPHPLRYRHIRVSGSKDRDETYLSLAVEAAVLGMGQQSIMPAGLYSQEKVIRQEERIIQRLSELQLDPTLISVLCKQAELLLEMGPSSSLGCGIHPESSPVHAFAKFMFLAILPHAPDLSFTLGKKALRLPILDDNKDPEDKERNAAVLVMSRFPRWFTLGHIENQQCSLASTLIIAAKDNPTQLTGIMESVQRHVHSSSHLFKLAQDAFRYAVPQQEGQRHLGLLNVAFQLGLQVMRLTKSTMNWRRREMVRWLVTCAIEVGLEALLSIMTMWSQLFTPTEATGPVATSLMSHATVVRLNLDYRKQEELSNCARTLALQCAHEDPPNCSLNALTLCETDPIAFETAYQIVTDAAANGMTSSQLFTIARYMEHRGYPHRAHKLAILAMKNVSLTYNQDTHPAITDIHWACALAHSLGKAELSGLLPLVVENVKCATVLSDILRRCSMSAPGKSKPSRPLSYDRSPLRQLLESALAAFVTTTHSRLTSISPRHYAEFIDFLTKARETFMLASDGHIQFSQLIDNIKTAYKGKKKLIALVKDRFG